MMKTLISIFLIFLLAVLPAMAAMDPYYPQEVATGLIITPRENLGAPWFGDDKLLTFGDGKDATISYDDAMDKLYFNNTPLYLEEDVEIGGTFTSPFTTATLVNETAINSSISSLTLAGYTNETAINSSISALTLAAYTNETAINSSLASFTIATYTNETAINTSISDLTTAAYTNETAINATADNVALGQTAQNDTLANLALGQTAQNVSITSLQGNDSMIGAIASGSLKFGAAADCTSVTIGGIVYTYAASPAAAGEWGPYGASGSDTATALAAGINTDTRNSGGPYFAATANTDTVTVYQLAVGVPATPAISKAGGSDTVTIEAFAGGVDPAYTDFVMFEHDVTALDVETAVLVNIPLPFAPSFYQAFITDASGVSRPTVTDTFSVGTTPNRIILTEGGAVHVVATDKIVIYAYE